MIVVIVIVITAIAAVGTVIAFPITVVILPITVIALIAVAIVMAAFAAIVARLTGRDCRFTVEIAAVIARLIMTAELSAIHILRRWTILDARLMLTAAAPAFKLLRGLMLLADLIVAATLVPILGPGLMMVPASAATVVIRFRMMGIGMRLV